MRLGKIGETRVHWITRRIRTTFWGTSGLACRGNLQPHPGSPLLPALAHADAAPVARRRVAAASLADLESDPTGGAAQGPRRPGCPRPVPGGAGGDRDRDVTL